MFQLTDLVTPATGVGAGAFIAGAAWAVKLLVPLVQQRKNGNGNGHVHVKRETSQIVFETETKLLLTQIQKNTECLPEIKVQLEILNSELRRERS